MHELIASAIRSFPFWNYGMDDVEDVKNEEWVDDLATKIAEAIDSKHG